jgi:hypothetical protein
MRTALASLIGVTLASLAAAQSRTVEIRDPRDQATAYTLQIPAGWRFAGELLRPEGCRAHGAAPKFTVQDPLNDTTLILLPGASWTWSGNVLSRRLAEQRRCPDIDINSAAAFLLNVAIPSLRPQAEIVELLPLLPDGQASIRDQLSRARTQSDAFAKKNQTNPFQVNIDGARVRLRYDREGHRVEEMVTAVIDCNQTTTQTTCSLRCTVVARAAEGHLDEFLASATYKNLTNSLKADPDWLTRKLAEDEAALRRDGSERPSFAEPPADSSMAAPSGPEFEDPNTGRVIQVDSRVNRQWHASDGIEHIVTFGPMNDRRIERDTVSAIWVELTAH